MLSELEAGVSSFMAEQTEDSPIARLGQIRDALGVAMTRWLSNVKGGYMGMTRGEKERWAECEEALGCPFHIWHEAFHGATKKG